MLPTEMCSGCPVNNTSRQPTACLKGQFFVNCPLSFDGSCFSTFVTVLCWADRVLPRNNNTNINLRMRLSWLARFRFVSGRLLTLLRVCLSGVCAFLVDLRVCLAGVCDFFVDLVATLAGVRPFLAGLRALSNFPN